MGHMGRKCIITNAIDFPSVTSNPAESNNTAAIVGSTISVIVLLLLLGVVVFFIWVSSIIFVGNTLLSLSLSLLI
ncbi:hypothetical protein GBAR_LOCUS21168 [Geodia barretti]|uniref:Uncharacterized protein n=1 Tax=Geodia barretti TaxID=519541 RepID=A0AA35SYZ1_GEOBA|nr:hypothetical protein GBAR_LOCUS21168 [Geodia barretti]